MEALLASSPWREGRSECGLTSTDWREAGSQGWTAGGSCNESGCLTYHPHQVRPLTQLHFCFSFPPFSYIIINNPSSGGTLISFGPSNYVLRLRLEPLTLCTSWVACVPELKRYKTTVRCFAMGRGSRKLSKKSAPTLSKLI